MIECIGCPAKISCLECSRQLCQPYKNMESKTDLQIHNSCAVRRVIEGHYIVFDECVCIECHDKQIKKEKQNEKSSTLD